MKRRGFIKTSAYAGGSILLGWLGYRAYTNRDQHLREMELGGLFNKIFKLPPPKEVTIEGLTKVDCSANPWDISPLVIKTVDFIENWHRDPKNVDRKLVINIGENHSIATQSLLYPVIAQNVMDRLPDQKLAFGIERSFNHIDRMYDMSSNAPMWDRYKNNGQWSPLISYLGFRTYDCGSTDKLKQRFLFHAANDGHASVWFNDAAIHNDALNRKQDPLLQRYMKEDNLLYPVSRDGYFFRNKVYATNIINQSEFSNSRISINHFGSTHLLGNIHQEAFDFLQSKKGTLKYSNVDDPVMHQYNIPYKTSIHSWMSAPSLQDRYDVLTVFADRPERRTGCIPIERQTSLTNQYNRTGNIAGFYASGLSIQKCEDFQDESDILRKVKENSPNISFPTEYSYDEAWYIKRIQEIEEQWGKEESSFVQADIIIPDFGR